MAASLWLISPTESIAQPGENVGIIHGYIKGFEKGRVMMLDGSGDSILAERDIYEGRFTLAHYLSDPQKCIFRILPGNINFRGIAEPGTSNVVVDMEKTQWNGDKGDPRTWGIIWHIEQRGSPIADDWQRMQDETALEKFTETSRHLYKQLDSLDEKKDSIAILRLQENINTFQTKQFEKIKTWIRAFIHNSPDSPSGPFLLYDLLTVDKFPDAGYYQSLLNAFRNKATQSRYFKQINNAIHQMANSSTGKKVPSFMAMQPNGDTLILDEYRGKYVLLDFWASWCAPCLAAIPALKNAYAQFGPKGLEIIGVSIDKDEKAWLRALNALQMTWPQVLDKKNTDQNEGSWSDHFYLQAIPLYVLIAPDGSIVLIENDAEKMIVALREQFF